MSIFEMFRSPKKEEEVKDPMDNVASSNTQKGEAQPRAEVAEGTVLTPGDEIERRRVQDMGDSWRDQK
jgi:hypothetical protein